MKNISIKIGAPDDQTNPLNVGEFKTADGETEFTLYVGKEEDEDNGNAE